MPRIPEYIAPDTKLTPSTAGIEAFSTEGRRIGGAYRVAAEDAVRAARMGIETGKIKAETDTQANQWPYTLATLLEDAQTTRGRGIGGFRMTGGAGSRSNDPISDFSNAPFPDLSRLNAQAQQTTSLLPSLDKFTQTMRQLIPTQTNPNAVAIVTGSPDPRAPGTGVWTAPPPIPEPRAMSDPAPSYQSGTPEGTPFGGVPDVSPPSPDFSNVDFGAAIP